MNTTAAVVVTYNRRELVDKCMESILNQQGASCDIFVIDNGSTDGTEELFSENASKYTGEVKTRRIVYTRFNKNAGLTAGLNYGIRVAKLNKYECIWILDDDMEADANALQVLQQKKKQLDNNWSCLSSYIYWKDGSTSNANRQKKGLFSFVKDHEYKNELIEVSMVSWGSMFINAKILRWAGLPISDFFIYTDDYEYSYRLSRIKPVYVVPKSRVKHNSASNKKASIADSLESDLNRYRCLFRNDVFFYRRFGVQGWLYLIIKNLYYSILVLTESTSKMQRMKIIWKGFNTGLSFSPKVAPITNDNMIETNGI